MDAEDISKRCVVFKNVPYRTTESQLRLWLDHVHNHAFRGRYTEVTSYMEDRNDKRWIVLFENEIDALDCIKTEEIEIETESDRVIKIIPDYCSECIVPEDWQKDPSEWVNVDKPDDQPFSLIPKDGRANSQSNFPSINSEDLFSEQLQNLNINDAPTRKSYSGSTNEEGRFSSEELFGSGKRRPLSTGSVDSSTMFGSGRGFTASGGFNTSQRSEQMATGIDNKLVENDKISPYDGKKIENAVKENQTSIKNKDTNDRSRPNTEVTKETLAREKQGSENTGNLAADELKKSNEENNIPGQNYPSQPLHPMYQGYPFPFVPYPGMPMSSEGMPTNIQNIYSQPYSAADGNRQFSQNPLMPQFGMIPPHAPPRMHGNQGEGQDNTKVVYVPVPVAPLHMAGVPDMPVMPGLQAGAQMPAAGVPGYYPPWTYMPGMMHQNMVNVQPQQTDQTNQVFSGIPGMPGLQDGAQMPGYYPPWSYMPGMMNQNMVNVQPQQNDQTNQVYSEPVEEPRCAMNDNEYLTPVQVEAGAKSADTSKQTQGDAAGKHGDKMMKRQASTSKDSEAVKDLDLDESGYVRFQTRKQNNESENATKEDEAENNKDENNEEIEYAAINEMELAGDKTLLRIKGRVQERQTVASKSGPPPIIPTRPQSMPSTTANKDSARTADADKRKATIDVDRRNVTVDVDRRNTTSDADRKKARMTIFEEGVSDEEELMDKTIKIEGLDEGVSQEMLELWVESSEVSGGGAEATSIKLLPEKQAAIVEMKYASDVDKILQKQKNLQGGFRLKQKKVRISIYTPPPIDRTKLFISGMKDGTSRDNLQNFIEVCCSSAPTMIQPGLTPGTALVTFDTPPDMNLFNERIKQRSLENCYLEVSEVEVSHSVKVEGYDPKGSHDALLYYFENKKRSNGGDVDRVEYQSENNVHIVHFLQPEDAVNVCKAEQHEVGGVRVTVSMYYPCLDLAPEYRVTIPDPVELDYLNQYIVRFLMKSSPFRMKFEMQMKRCSASVVWPNDAEMPVKLVCDIDPIEKGAREKIEDWQDKCRQEVEAVCDNLDVNEEIHVAKEVWSSVRERLRDMTLSEPDMVMVTLKKEECLIIVFGLKDAVEKVSRDILMIVSELEQSHTAEQQPITKSKTLKTYQAALLRTVKFAERSTTSGLSVSMNDRLIEFTGGKREVDSCIQKMYQRLKEFAHRSVQGYVKAAKDLLFQKETRNYIKKQVNRKRLICVWDVIRGSDLVVYSKTDKDLDEVVNILLKTLMQTTVSLDAAMKKMTQSKEWESHLTEMRNNSEYAGLMNIEVKLTEIVIVGVDCVFQKVYDDISKFFDLHGDVFEFLEVDSGKFLYLTRYKKLDLENIEKQYRTLDIRIDHISKSSRKGFKIHGKKDGCRLAIARIQELVDNVTYKDVTIMKAGFKEFIKRSEGKSELHNIEISESCVLLPEITDTDERRTSQSGDLAKEAGSCKIGRCSVRVMEGDITTLEVDGIINPTLNMLTNSMGLGSTIIDKGGFEIQKECAEFTRQNSDLSDAEVFVSKAGKLPCKKIFHVALPRWKGGANNERSLLRQAVENCLSAAADCRCKSVAMTIMGAGMMGYPKDVAAKNIIEMIKRYIDNNGRSTSIGTIYLCDRQGENVQVFIDELKNKLGSAEVCVYKDTGSSNSSGSSTGSSSSTDDVTGQCPTITVVEGELVKQTVDVIVNSTNENLNLSVGIVSRTLLKMGGDAIQKECRDKYPNGIKIGEVAKTTGGTLNCKKIYHGMLQPWDGGQGHADAVMGTFITRCLKEAEKEKRTSMAFPALGTGNLGFPADIVANLMFKCIRNHHTSHLRDVKLVVWSGDVQAVQAFNDAARQYKKKQQMGGRQRNPSFESYQPSTDLIRNPGKDFKMTIENVTVEIVQGDITKQKTGAIVNSVLKDLNLSNGHVSKAILDAGGSTIQTECDLKKAKMEKYGFVVTSPGRLFCQKIIHMKAKSTEQGWDKMIKLVLQEVENLGLNSVTFPALGTGGRGISPDVMGRLMMSSFQQYVTSHDYKQCLKSIRIVIYETPMLEAFISSVKENPSGFTRVKSMVKDLLLRPKKLDVSSVKIHVYIDSLHHLETVKKKLEDLFSEQRVYVSKRMLENMEEHQIRTIKSKEEIQNINISLDARGGYIKLQGYGDSVNTVARDIENYVRQIGRDDQPSALMTMPKCWSKMSANDPMNVEVLQSHSMEYVKIFNKFQSEAGINRRVIQIERIQNPALFTQYILKKHQMEQANKGSRFPVERRLWHGTKNPGAIDSINNTGFNWNNAGYSNTTGVYFAVHASTALRYCMPDASNHYHMYYAHVLTGNCNDGSEAIRQNRPVKSSSSSRKISSVIYDSTTDNLQSPNTFVIHNDSQAYPSYHIVFT